MAIFPGEGYLSTVKVSFFLTILLSLVFSALAHADYTGTVGRIKPLTGGGIAIYLDGEEANAKMTLYVSSKELKTIGPIPPVGAKVTATGTETRRKKRREIKILSAEQWKW